MKQKNFEKKPTVTLKKQNEIAKEVTKNFVLNVYHKGLCKSNGLIKKSIVRKEFKAFVKENSYGKHFKNANVGTLLRNTNLLHNTSRGSEDFCIAMKKLYEFRNEKMKELDQMQLHHSRFSQLTFLDEDNISGTPLEAIEEVDTENEVFPVIYQGGCKQNILPNFLLTSLGCYICQKNFKTQSDFEDHISIHGFESDFEFLSSSHKEMDNNFELTYRLCNKSHLFHFTLTTATNDAIIEKIIVVQTRMFHYVKNFKVPYEIPNGIDSFVIDSDLFTMGVEQPIVVIYKFKSDKDVRFFEQHHFLRTEEFPQVYLPIRSYRLSSATTLIYKSKLQKYIPIKAMRTAEKAGFSDVALSAVSEKLRKYIVEEKVLNVNNACDILENLLQIEDLEADYDYFVLDQKAVKIKRFGREYSVRLKKLPRGIYLENIVSPLDEIVLVETVQKRTGGRMRTRNIYTAIIEKVYFNQICFKNERGFKNERAFICEKKIYDITIRPSRLTLRYQYRALAMLKTNFRMLHYLYPSADFIPNRRPSTMNLKLFNSSIESNPEQMQAIQNICDEYNSNSSPYIIFGPPGTGKTSVIVEAVLQLWLNSPYSKILVTASSNGACDEVALRLCKIFAILAPEKPNLLRLFAKSNEKRIENIDDVLIEASNIYSSHFYPGIQAIRQYRILVCTLSIVGKLVTAEIGENFFTHIFIDECAASTESDVFVGLMGTATRSTRLIVSGDHKQLGPVIKSQRAAELGLKVSFMERLINQKCYNVDAAGDYDRSIQTRLIQNFRSHHEIVGLYNRMYYDGKLKAMAKEDDVNWALNWHLLPNKEIPIIFHSVYGDCKRKSNQLSFCNELEVSTVIDYVKDLLYFGINNRKILETDIGIISPYKKQFTRIQEELNHRQWRQIEVGSVETFQGKEKNIIIFSTVRSFTALGFLENPRRLNVLLSRAKVLLIMIGNPRTLKQNKDYKYIIDECRKKQCTVGCFKGYDQKLPNVREEDKLSAKMEACKLNPTESTDIKRSSSVSSLHLDLNLDLDTKILFFPVIQNNLKETESNANPKLAINSQEYEINFMNSVGTTVKIQNPDSPSSANDAHKTIINSFDNINVPVISFQPINSNLRTNIGTTNENSRQPSETINFNFVSYTGTTSANTRQSSETINANCESYIETTSTNTPQPEIKANNNSSELFKNSNDIRDPLVMSLKRTNSPTIDYEHILFSRGFDREFSHSYYEITEQKPIKKTCVIS